MYKSIKITLLFVFIAQFPVFATTTSADSGIPTTAIANSTGKLIGVVNANGTGVVGQLASNWNSNFPNGPFIVRLFDQTANIWSAPVVTNNAFMIFNGLTHGSTYQVHVQDNDSVKLSDPVTL